MGLEEFEPIFGKPRAEWSAPTSTPLKPFLYHVYRLDLSRLRITVTDFLSNTWEAVRTVVQLEDMRDNIGIGGPWSEFVDYIISSIKFGDVKLVLEGQSKSNGPESAKLIAQKSKRLPLISVSLDKLVGAAASEAMANLSLELYIAFKSNHKLLVDEQERRCQLTQLMAAEREKNENIQKQLDVLLFSKRQKLQRRNDKATSDSLSGSLPQDTSAADKQASIASTKVANRVVAAIRRAKVRGVILDDTEELSDD